MSIKTMFMSKNPRVDLINITPEMAQAILNECNTNNRNVRSVVVGQYSRDMGNDNWIFDGMPIRFKTDGTLFDGQHRLSAIVNSGSSQNMVVVLGLDKDSQLVMDCGVKRTVKDNLSLARGYNYSNIIYAAINIACGSAFKCCSLSASDIEKFIEVYGDFLNIVNEHFTSNKRGIRNSLVPGACLKALASGENIDTVIGFIETFCNPSFDDMSPGKITVQKLREKMISEPIRGSGSERYDFLKLIERVFEAYKNDVLLTKFYTPNSFTYPFINVGNVYKEKSLEIA